MKSQLSVLIERWPCKLASYAVREKERMMNSVKSLPYLFLLLTLSACGSDDGGAGEPIDPNLNQNKVTMGMPSEITRLEFPKVKGETSIVVVHYADVPNSKENVNYAVEWDGKKKANRWTCYQMYASNRVRNTNRYESETNQYPQDPDLPQEYRWETDPFWRTGYDHGHLCPSADRLYSSQANYQTFFLSNMSPQLHAFNAGVWENMESQLREWITVGSSRSDTLYVCKGGTIDAPNQILTTLSSGLIVPRYFFCALLMKNSAGYKALGFWFEHKANSSARLSDYVVNIDQLESLTGLDFFCNLVDETENHVESLPVENVKRAWGLGD